MSESVLARIGELVQSQRFAVLCTRSEGWPYASLVAVAAEPDLKHLYFATPSNTQKTANLHADGRVALLMDNRSNRSEDCQLGAAVTFLGRAEFLSADAGARRLYLARHPELKSFLDDPATAFVAVHIERCRLVEQFQHTTDVTF